MLRKKKICDGCQKETYIFSRGRCQACAKASYSRPKQSGAKTKFSGNPKRNNKKTGEIIIFREIWEERPHKCEVCSVYLPVFDHWNYAHCLSKGSHGKFRLNKDNIILMCRKCHSQYDNGSVVNDKSFKWVLEKKEKLKQQYYESNTRI